MSERDGSRTSVLSSGWFLWLSVCLAALPAGAAPGGSARPAPGTGVALVALDGGSADLAGAVRANAGEGGTFVLVWSLYQPDSRRALRRLQVFQAQYAERVGAIAVAIPEYRESPATIGDFLGRARVTLPVFIDPDGSSLVAFGRPTRDVVGLPATFLVRGDGSVTEVATGSDDGYEDALRKVLPPASGSRGTGAGGAGGGDGSGGGAGVDEDAGRDRGGEGDDAGRDGDR